MSALDTSPLPNRPSRRSWTAWANDIIAALISAVVSVPDELASAALAGVNPVWLDCPRVAGAHSYRGPIVACVSLRMQKDDRSRARFRH
jgi:hypothetical protein